MAHSEQEKEIYIVLTRTGTWVSKMIRLFTGAEFNHASISLSKDLKDMYSFGRRHPYNPVWAGFIREIPNEGTFKRFPDTRAAVLRVNVSAEAFENIEKRLDSMFSEKMKYKFNYLGLGFAAINRPRKKQNCYYCSEFVGELLTDNKILGFERLPRVIQPIDFLSLDYEQIYSGLLSQYK